MSSAAEIAAGLTEKEALAVRGTYPWESILEEEQGEERLYALGIWNPRPKRHESILTPLGKEVLAALKASGQGEG